MRSLAFMLVWLLGSVAAHAQGFGQSLPFLAKDATAQGISYDVTYSNMVYWWVGTNAQVAEGTSSVTNWPDLVQQKLWTNANSSIAPTKSGNYVDFVKASSQYLTNADTTIPVGNNKWTVGFIFKHDDTASAWVLAASAIVGFLLLAPDPDDFSYLAGPHNYMSRNIPSATTIDVIGTWNGAGPSTLTAYTNGIPSVTNSIAQGLQTLPLLSLGIGVDGSYAFDGKIYELVIWTNVLTTLQISNFHYYATNTYSFSP